MTICLGKSCSFDLLRVPFVNCCQFMYLVISLLVLRAGYGIWLCQFLIIAYLFTLFQMHDAKDTNYQFTKIKDDIKNADNYRGITIFSCFGKLFTSILNHRFNTFLENSGLLQEGQAGFRKNYDTTDHIFSLKMLVDFYFFKKNIFIAPLLTVKRLLILWIELHYGITYYKIIILTVTFLKLFIICMKKQNRVSCPAVKYQTSLVARQSENLSQILFSMFFFNWSYIINI